MKRTISVMLGKGSVSHNSRKSKAANIDSERTGQNITYCNEPIKEVYHNLFDDALQRYNDKQKRSDRRIDDYYEKIRTGKQENFSMRSFCKLETRRTWRPFRRMASLPPKCWMNI